MTKEKEDSAGWIYLVDKRGDRHPVMRLTEEDIIKIQDQIKAVNAVDIPGKVYFYPEQIIGFSSMYDRNAHFCEFGLRKPPELKVSK